MVNSSDTTPGNRPGESLAQANSSENAPESTVLQQNQETLSAPRNLLGKHLRRILPKHCLRERKKLQIVVEMSAKGIPWRDIEKKTGVTWLQVNVLLRRYTGWRDLWHAARDAGEERRKEIRESEAHRRAVDGYTEPVFFQGKKCGTVTKFSDKLHELLLRADNPEKYSDHSQVKHTGTGAEVGGITVIFNGVEFGQQPQYVPPPPPSKPPVTIDLPPCQDSTPPQDNALQGKLESHSVTNPAPKPPKPPKQAKTTP